MKNIILNISPRDFMYRTLDSSLFDSFESIAKSSLDLNETEFILTPVNYDILENIALEANSNIVIDNVAMFHSSPYAQGSLLC